MQAFSPTMKPHPRGATRAKRNPRMAEREAVPPPTTRAKSPKTPLASYLTMRYNTSVLEMTGTLTESITRLRTATQADAAQKNHGPIQTLLLAILTRLFSSLERMIHTWQAGQHQTPQPPAKAASKKTHMETARRGKARTGLSPRTSPSPRLPVHPARAPHRRRASPPHAPHPGTGAERSTPLRRPAALQTLLPHPRPTCTPATPAPPHPL
jgi:hypothetical protein